MVESEHQFPEEDISDLETRGVIQNKSDIVEMSPKGQFCKFNDIIGSWAFKVIYRGYDNHVGCEIAWHSVKIKHLSRKQQKNLVTEVKLLESLKNPNIIQFVKAWVSPNKEEVIYITDISTGGSLKSYLRKIKSPYLKVIKRWCISILTGLVYLHTQQPHPIIHRDLKWENIFIDANNGDCKIGDFGLSTLAKSSGNTTVLGTPEFMSPEVFNENYGPKADVYSFGMCVLEMVTNHTPYRECNNPGAVYKKVIEGIYPRDLDRILDEDVKAFITLCISPEPQRPTSTEILQHDFLTSEVDKATLNQPVPLSDEVSPAATPRRATEFTSPEFDMEKKYYEEKRRNTEFVELQSVCKLREENKEESGSSGSRILPKHSQEHKDDHTHTESPSVTPVPNNIIQLEFEFFAHRKKMKAQFEFNIANDTPNLVAQEFVDALELDQHLVAEYTEVIFEWVSKAMQASGSDDSQILLRSNSLRSLQESPTTTDKLSTVMRVENEDKTTRLLRVESDITMDQKINKEQRENIEAMTKKLNEEKEMERTIPDLKTTLTVETENDKDAVKQVQVTLNELMGMQLRISGIFGEKTEKAVKQFQEQHCLLVDGLVNNTTWKKMQMENYKLQKRIEQSNREQQEQKQIKKQQRAEQQVAAGQ